jgi:hypothetical protein
LHPDLVWKLKYEGYTGELRDLIAIRGSIGVLPDHVRLVLPDTDISSYSFFSITDYCLTVRGTIGIEMSCHGIPVITAGTGRYSGLGFTIDSDTAGQYLARLADIASIPPMSPEQVHLARKFAYTLFKGRLWPMRSFEMTKMPIEETGHPLDHDVVPRLHSHRQLEVAIDLQDLVKWINSSDPDYLHSDRLRV